MSLMPPDHAVGPTPRRYFLQERAQELRLALAATEDEREWGDPEYDASEEMSIRRTLAATEATLAEMTAREATA